MKIYALAVYFLAYQDGKAYNVLHLDKNELFSATHVTNDQANSLRTYFDIMWCSEKCREMALSVWMHERTSEVKSPATQNSTIPFHFTAKILQQKSAVEWNFHNCFLQPPK